MNTILTKISWTNSLTWLKRGLLILGVFYFVAGTGHPLYANPLPVISGGQLKIAEGEGTPKVYRYSISLDDFDESLMPDEFYVETGAYLRIHYNPCDDQPEDTPWRYRGRDSGNMAWMMPLNIANLDCERQERYTYSVYVGSEEGEESLVAKFLVKLGRPLIEIYGPAGAPISFYVSGEPAVLRSAGEFSGDLIIKFAAEVPTDGDNQDDPEEGDDPPTIDEDPGDWGDPLVVTDDPEPDSPGEGQGVEGSDDPNFDPKVTTPELGGGQALSLSGGGLACSLGTAARTGYLSLDFILLALMWIGGSWSQFRKGKKR